MIPTRVLYSPSSSKAVKKNNSVEEIINIINELVNHSDVPISILRQNADIDAKLQRFIKVAEISHKNVDDDNYKKIYSKIREIYSERKLIPGTLGEFLGGCVSANFDVCSPKCFGSLKPPMDEGGTYCPHPIIIVNEDGSIRMFNSSSSELHNTAKIYLLGSASRKTISKTMMKKIKNHGISTVSVYKWEESGATTAIYEFKDIDDIIKSSYEHGDCKCDNNKNNSYSWLWVVLLIIIIIIILVTLLLFLV